MKRINKDFEYTKEDILNLNSKENNEHQLQNAHLN